MKDGPEDWDVDLYSLDPETGEKTHVSEGQLVYDDPETRREKVKERLSRIRWWLPF